MKPFERITNPREIRRKLHLNQQEFWSRIGVTQSGGSRYESGRTMPKPVRELLRLVHIEGIELEKARGSDFEVVSYLRRANPKLFQSLRKAASGRTPTTTGRASSAPARSNRSSRMRRR
jgi:transcriptional regulator with XRE-family HTH domain